jgi:hypothetical protein
MSRAAGGTYTLPTGNPVISGTDITVTWGNTTMNDVATEMTDSLSRSGKGGMLAPLTFTSGTPTVPGMSWVSDTNTGFYSIGADNMGMTAGGVKIVDYANGAYSFIDTSAAATVGPIFSIFRDSASPADADFIGEIRFDGEDDGSVKTTYAAISGQIDDVTDGTEDGTLLVKTMTAGTLTTQLTISDSASTFAGDITLDATSLGSTVRFIPAVNTSLSTIRFDEAAGTQRASLDFLSNTGDMFIKSGTSGWGGTIDLWTNGVTALKIDTSQNATFAGNVTMSGGYKTLTISGGVGDALVRSTATGVEFGTGNATNAAIITNGARRLTIDSAGALVLMAHYTQTFMPQGQLYN